MGGGRLLEDDDLFDRYCAYWLSRAKGGVQWVGGEPLTGPTMHAMFAERMGEYLARLHAANGYGTVQLDLSGATGADGGGVELIRRCSEAAILAAHAGADAIELRSSEGRFLAGIVGAIRATIDRPITIGVRLNLGEMLESGRQVAHCQQLIENLTTDRTIDYFAVDVGGDVDARSRIAAGTYDENARAELCG